MEVEEPKALMQGADFREAQIGDNNNIDASTNLYLRPKYVFVMQDGERSQLLAIEKGNDVSLRLGLATQDMIKNVTRKELEYHIIATKDILSGFCEQVGAVTRAPSLCFHTDCLFHMIIPSVPVNFSPCPMLAWSDILDYYVVFSDQNTAFDWMTTPFEYGTTKDTGKILYACVCRNLSEKLLVLGYYSSKSGYESIDWERKVIGNPALLGFYSSPRLDQNLRVKFEKSYREVELLFTQRNLTSQDVEIVIGWKNFRNIIYRQEGNVLAFLASKESRDTISGSHDHENFDGTLDIELKTRITLQNYCKKCKRMTTTKHYVNLQFKRGAPKCDDCGRIL